MNRKKHNQRKTYRCRDTYTGTHRNPLKTQTKIRNYKKQEKQSQPKYYGTKEKSLPKYH